MSGDTVAEEREVKLAVDHTFTFPPFTGINGISVEDHGERRLDAVYWDTPDLALARAGVGLRHRDGTWTYKGRSRHDGAAVVRSEHEVSGPGTTVPAPLLDALGDESVAQRLGPIVEVVTHRRTRIVRRADEHVEVVDDRVVVVADGTALDRFSAVEVEYQHHSEGLAREVVDVLIGAGAVLDHTAKYVRALRALGRDVPEVLEGAS